jgi:hypothetical protein
MSSSPRTPRRKPARLERHGAMTPRDLIWAAIRLIGPENVFSVAEIMVLATASRAGGADTKPLCEATVAEYCSALDKGGFIAPMHPPHPGARTYRCLRTYQLMNDCGVNAPRLDANGKVIHDARQQMWNTMRMVKGEFTRTDLMHTASTKECVVGEEAAKFFCAHLERAGYLVPTGSKKQHVFTRYRFVKARDTGPRPPVIANDKSVMDGNTGTVMCAGFDDSPSPRPSPASGRGGGAVVRA